MRIIWQSKHWHFNPLPPHGGRHQRLNDLRQCINYFNPLPPHGGRLQQATLTTHGKTISIHSLRMEGDLGKIEFTIQMQYISIHSLRMEGDLHFDVAIFWIFISIHSLRMEGDVGQIIFTIIS